MKERVIGQQLSRRSDSLTGGMTGRLVGGSRENELSTKTRLLTAQQTAEMLQVSVTRIYELARLGTVPCVRIRRQLRFDEAALLNWVAQGGELISKAG